MNKENLVVLKQPFNSILYNSITFKANTFYRCEPNGEDTYIVFGTNMSKYVLDDMFETAHERIMRDWKDLDLLKDNGKPLSKQIFEGKLDIHRYGNRRNPLKILLVRNSRTLMYGFYPEQGTTRNNINECYKMYLKIISGDMEDVDIGDVQFGNYGIPIAYGNLRVY